MRATKYYAIIDIGSNSVRLVIYAKRNTGRLQEVENVKAVARLKNDLDKDLRLSKEGLNKLLRILTSFQAVLKTYKIAKLYCVATAAIREAKNKDVIIKRINQEFGWEVLVLSEQEEAYYGYLAVTHSTSLTEGITLDIGGGSAEVTYFKNRELIHSHSFPFGVLTLQPFFETKESRKKQMKKVQVFLMSEFKTLPWLKNKKVPLIAIGGSARSFVEVHQNLIDYPLAGLHQYAMTENSMEKVCQYLLRFKNEDIEKIDGVSKDRADTILPASFVFLTLYKTIQSQHFILSRKGLRDGFFYEKVMRRTKKFPNVLKESMVELVDEYALDLKQIDKIHYVAKEIVHTLIKNQIGGLDPNDWPYVELAGYVYHLGGYIDSESSSQHTFYLLANRTIEGLMHIDRVRIALLASFKNKTVFNQYVAPFTKWFSKKEQAKLALLGAILKLAYSLDSTNRQIVQEVELRIVKNDIKLTAYCNQNYLPEQHQAEKQKKHVEKAIGRNIQLDFSIK